MLKIDKQLSTNPDFDLPQSILTVKGRGNRSWAQDKKPFAIKMDKKTSIMGMPKHKRWVLLANALDRTLMRNMLAFQLSKSIGKQSGLVSDGLEWSSGGQFVELVFNGTYRGSYVLCEHIRIDDNRVPITEYDKKTYTSPENIGYLMEIDHHYDEDYRFFSQWGNLPIMVKNPDQEVIEVDATMNTYVKGCIAEFESIIFDADFPAKGSGKGGAGDKDYKTLINSASFADWWIVHELVYGFETRILGSWYIYLKQKTGTADKGVIYAGPPWDFDLYGFISASSWIFYDQDVRTHRENYFTSKPNREFKPWLFWLFKDPDFVDLVKQRWAIYRSALQTNIPSYITEQKNYIAKSAAINWTVWPLVMTSENQDNRDGNVDFSSAVDIMYGNYNSRLSWLDGKITSLQANTGGADFVYQP